MIFCSSKHSFVGKSPVTAAVYETVNVLNVVSWKRPGFLLKMSDAATPFIYTEERLKYDGNIHTHALRQTNSTNTRRNILMVVGVEIFCFPFQGSKKCISATAHLTAERANSDYSALN